jgi:hypothetical protein
MDNRSGQDWQELWYIWAAVAGVVIGGVLWLAFACSTPRHAPQPSGAQGMQHATGDSGRVQIAADPKTLPHADKLSQLDRFLEWIRQHQPTVDAPSYPDPVDGDRQVVPSVNMHNNFVGGQATDMMSLTLGLDDRRPVPK